MHRTLALSLILAVPVLVMACGGDDAGLTRAEVEEIVRAELANAEAPPRPEAALSRADVEQIARGVLASVPSESDPAEYTRFFVDRAMSRYETHGLPATLAYYSRPESVEGQWYVFIIDEDNEVVAHPDPDRIGLDMEGWVGTDANGYTFGPEMLSATEEGKWVSYVFRNPDTGDIGSNLADLELKNAWVVRHDGLLFGSGWYITADRFTEHLVSVAVSKFRAEGLASTIQYFADPGSALAGLEAAIEYYNSAETVEGEWFAFIAEERGAVVAHSDPDLVGMPLSDVIHFELGSATDDGLWVNEGSTHIYVANYGGMTFGSGWQDHHDHEH